MTSPPCVENDDCAPPKLCVVSVVTVALEVGLC